MAAGRLRVAGVEAWVRPADVGRGDGAVVAADVAADAVVRAAVVEDRGDVVRAHEGQRHERAGRSRLTDTAQAVLDRAVAHLAGIRPAGVLDRLVAWRQGGVCLRRERGQEEAAQGEDQNENPHCL